MATLELTDEQIVGLIRQLAPDRRRQVLHLLNEISTSEREARGRALEGRLARVAAERGLNWDDMTEDQREDLIDDLVHEVRRERAR